MSFLDFTNLVSDDQLSELAALNAERAAEGKELITLLDVMADDTILESTGVTTTSAEAEATLNEMAAINDAAAGLSEVDRFTGKDTNEVIRDLVQENIDAGGTPDVVNLIETYIDDQANATVELAGGELDLSDLADYGQGSSPVLAPDGKGVIRGGRYISLDPTQSSLNYREVQELKGFATRNTNLLLAQQEFEDNGTPIAETLGLKMPGDDNFDRDDRERIQEAENAAAVLLREQSNLDYHRYLQKKSESGPSAIEIHNQIFGGGGNAPGTVKQDENGDWYAVKQIEGTNALGRDYSIDPKDDNKGPTFGGNVSKDIEEMFPNEVAAAGGSSDYTGSIKDIFKDTDVSSLGYDPATGTYTPPEPVVETPSDIAQPGDLDVPEVSVEPLEGTPADLVQQAGMDDLSGLDLLAEETGAVEGFTPTADTFNAVNTFMEDDQFTRPSNIYTDDVINRMDDDDDFSEQVATDALTPQEISDLAASALDNVDEEALYGPVEISIAGFTEEGLADEVAKYTGSEDPPGVIASASEILNYIKSNPDLSLTEVAQGLGYSSAGGFMEELALRAQGTGTMIDDALNFLAGRNLIRDAAVINPEYADNLAALEDLSGLDMLALETRAAELGVPVASLLNPLISDSTGASIPMSVTQEGGEYGIGEYLLGTMGEYNPATGKVEGGSGIAASLNEKSGGLFASLPEDYRDAIIQGMPDPNNIGFTIGGNPITDPSLWMLDTAIQEVGGLLVDGIPMLINAPVGIALSLQQNIAEAGAAASNDVADQMDALRDTAFKDLSDEEFKDAKDAAMTQGFYTAGLSGGVVDTMSAALALGAPKILVKALPGVLTRVSTVLGSEFLAGGLEQGSVNQAVISAMKAEGLNPEDYDVDLLNGTFNAAWSEMFGAGPAAVGTAFQGNAAGNVDVGASTAGSSLPAGAGQDNNPNEGPDLIAAQGLNTIESNEVTDSNGVVYLVDTAVDANGNTSVTVTNKNTNTSKTTNVSTGNTNVVSVGANTSVFVDSTNTNNSNTVNVSTLTPGSEVTVGGGEGLLNDDVDDTEVLKATGTDDISSDGVLTYDPNRVLTYDPNTVYRRNNISYLGDPSNGVLADGNINGTVYKDGQVVFGTGEAEGTNIVNNVDVSGTGIAGVIQGDGTGDGTATGNLTLVGDSSTTTNGDLTITTVTDADGNATVSTTNNVTGENTITNVSVGDSTSVTNGNTTVDINADTNGTTTQTTDNKVTTVEDGSSTVNTGVNVVTTVEEPEYQFGDPGVTIPPDVTIPPIETVFVPETEFTPEDDEEPPVGEQDPGYTSGIAGLSGARPTVAPYYQPQQTGQYSFYVPQPGVDQTVPAGPVFTDPTSYLAPTASPQYGYGYIAPNAELEYLRRLAEIQGTGDEKLPSENLMDGS